MLQQLNFFKEEQKRVAREEYYTLCADLNRDKDFLFGGTPVDELPEKLGHYKRTVCSNVFNEKNPLPLKTRQKEFLHMLGLVERGAREGVYGTRTATSILEFFVLCYSEEAYQKIKPLIEKNILDVNRKGEIYASPLNFALESPYNLKAAVALVKLGANLITYNSKGDSLVTLLNKLGEKDLLTELETYLSEQASVEKTNNQKEFK